MKVRLLRFAFVLLLIPVTSIACRCEQLPFANYFQAAEFVAMANLSWLNIMPVPWGR